MRLIYVVDTKKLLLGKKKITARGGSLFISIGADGEYREKGSRNGDIIERG